MKRFDRTLPLLLLLSGALAVAQADEPTAAHDGHQPAGDDARMHDHMREMRDLMTRIHATTDASKRHELLEKHRELMQEQMRAMKGMGHMGKGCDGMMDQMLDQMTQHEQADEHAGDKHAH